MNMIIVARERSSRFPNKHLTKIGDMTLIEGIVQKCLRHGYAYLATGSRADNGSLGQEAYLSGASVYYEEDRPEWDIYSRVTNLCERYGLESFFLVSGDSPWFEERYLELYGRKIPPDGKFFNAEPWLAKPDIESRTVSHMSLGYWKSLCEGVALDDRRREEPGGMNTEEQSRAAEIRVPVPWKRLHGTAIKLSIDYPFEAAIANRIVAHLGFWPRTDDDILKAYTEITEL